jgi:hypothetical protein
MADGERHLLAPRVLRDGHKIYWWLESGLVVVIVLVVAVLVPAIKPPSVPPGALGNAVDLVDFERTFGLFFEHAVQRAAFDLGTWALIAANWWYCIMHFAVTAAVFVWLFRRHSDDYPRWRNTLAISAVLTLAIQAVYPLTPPRLLHGAAHAPIFRDTLATFSSPWSFSRSGGVANQYAAMPSMHIVWAFICACVLVPRVTHRSAKVAAAIYPLITVLAIVVTGNHYIADALGAVPIVGIGWLVARRFTRAGRGESVQPEEPGRSSAAAGSS